MTLLAIVAVKVTPFFGFVWSRVPLNWRKWAGRQCVYVALRVVQLGTHACGVLQRVGEIARGVSGNPRLRPGDVLRGAQRPSIDIVGRAAMAPAE